MGSVKVTVYGRAKPCPKSLQSKEYRIKSGENEDYITFTTTKPLPTKKSYRFRKIFNEQATQEEVFDVVAKPIIENVLSGYNGTIFTYGQTGSGKTHTMTGDIEQWVYPGLIPRAIQRIFQLKDKDVTVSVTYCEIYNEHVYDLIRSDRPESDITNVSLLEDSAGVTHFRNLSVHIVNTAYEAIQLLIRGDANKMVAETTSNAKSSRSHVLFSITLEVPHPNQENYYLKPVLYLVDLAGSEKLSKCKTQMANPWETRYINLSLHYLEQVLLALRQPGRVHIPYRNSLMTALLRNSLGGNCITAMIATFCLSVEDIDETIQTCRFAERIALIKNEVKISDVLNPEREIEELRKENKRLRSQIKLMGGQTDSKEELNEEEKEKCAELVQGFIESSTVDSLPFTDIKRMEYCLCLMRDEIVRRPRTENNSGNVIEFFKNCPRLNTCNSEGQKNIVINLIKPDKNWKKKKNAVHLPKVNITYKRWRSTEHLAEKVESTCKKISTADGGERKMIFSTGKMLRAPSIEVYKNHKFEQESHEEIQMNRFYHKTVGKSCYLARCYLTERGNPKSDRRDEVRVSRNSSTEEIELTEEESLASCTQNPTSLSNTISATTFKIEMLDDENGRGERHAHGKLKKLISIGVQIDGGINGEAEEPIAKPMQKVAIEETVKRKENESKEERKDYSEDDCDDEDSTAFVDVDVKKSSEGNQEDYEGDQSTVSADSNQLSWTYLPLTGDEEVDEEIVKFYKARYKIFNRQDK